MTESEWLNCADPGPMLEFLRWQASSRQFRLFAVACCRRIWAWLEKTSQDAVCVAESFTDGRATIADLELAYGFVSRDALYSFGDDRPANAAMSATDPAMGPGCAASAAAEVVEARRIEAAKDDHRWRTLTELAVVAKAEREQAILLRDIIGNPFQPITISRARLTPAIVSLAEAMYNDRSFERMPELVDALARGGYSNKEVFDHCWGQVSHVRGCWVIDMMLGKE